MKCQKCGKEIKELRIDFFEYDGRDDFYLRPIKQVSDNAVIIDVDENWTGYELTDEERKETIECPYCKKYPFKDDLEIQIYEVVRVVCFKK